MFTDWRWKNFRGKYSRQWRASGSFLRIQPLCESLRRRTKTDWIWKLLTWATIFYGVWKCVVWNSDQSCNEICFGGQPLPGTNTIARHSVKLKGIFKCFSMQTWTENVSKGKRSMYNLVEIFFYYIAKMWKICSIMKFLWAIFWRNFIKKLVIKYFWFIVLFQFSSWVWS